MADVGLGQLATVTGLARSKVLKDAVSDNIPGYDLMQAAGGVRRVSGGSQIVESAITAPNATSTWVGETGQVSIADTKVVDSAVFDWRYMLAAVTWSLAERYKNSGGAQTQYFDIVGAKYKAAEATMMNQFQEGFLSNGTGYSGLQLIGLASLVSTTPTTGTVGGIDRSSANAAWFRNQKFDTSVDWTEGATSPGNIKRFFDKGINATTRSGKRMKQVIYAGNTHFEYLTQATQAIQVINDSNGTGEAGFQKIKYRGADVYLGGGINYSGYSALTATRSYILCVEEGGVNIVFHDKAEFDMLEPVNSQDQAAVSRLLFTMTAATIGGLAKFCWVGFD